MAFCKDRIRPTMAQLTDILPYLDVEPLEAHLFRGQNDASTPHVFGGQVLAQAISAAYHTVAGDRILHSLHSYFIRAGDWNRPIVYDVERIRDGKSFTTRRVLALQDGRAILSMDASFQTEKTAWNTRERPQRSRSLKIFAAITTAIGSLPSSTRALGALPFATRPSRAGRWRAFS